jgi:uncharacterized protein
MRILIVPGLGGSEPEHWQSQWERSYPGATRVEQSDWNRPVRARWMRRLVEAVENTPGAILVGHSLGCVLIAHLAHRRPDLAIGGALLAAPADVYRVDHAQPELRDFAPTPLARMPFPAVVVASTNDPFSTIDRARLLARVGRELRRCGPLRSHQRRLRLRAVAAGREHSARIGSQCECALG